MQVIELRNYRLEHGRTADFIRYFEEHFLVSQRDEGMQVLGQFTVVDQPGRFVWIRGFADMKARRRGLDGFYDGAFWQARRSEANAMIRDHTDVHLLRPLGPLDLLTGGVSLAERASAPPGVVSPAAGLVVVDFYRATGGLDRLVHALDKRLRSELLERRHQILGHFVAELAPNDYPRLPVTQDPALLVVIGAYRDRTHHAQLTGESDLRAELRSLSTAEVVTLHLQPTARSIVRYRAPDTG
jgi:hypothetical protein